MRKLLPIPTLVNETEYIELQRARGSAAIARESMIEVACHMNRDPNADMNALRQIWERIDNFTVLLRCPENKEG